MLKRKDKMIIVFSSLKEGMHHFEFEVTPEFFKQFEYSLIHEAHVNVKISMEKRSNMLLFDFKFKGEVHTDCARCTEDVMVPVSGSEELIVKFGDEQINETDEILIIDENAFEIDLSQQIYEYIHLLLPERNVHKNIKDCDQTVIEKLNKLSVKKDSEGDDPRWDALKNLKN